MPHRRLLCVWGKVFGEILLRVIFMVNDEKMLNAILKTAQMGRFGIETVMDKAVGPGLKQELRDQKAEYDTIENKAHALARSRNLELQGLPTATRYMASMMGRLSIMGSQRDSKIAGMLIQGNAMGLIKGMKYLNRSKNCDADVVELARKLTDREQENMKNAQPFL